jgi:SOS-response transcriptional repressor LexA
MGNNEGCSGKQHPRTAGDGDPSLTPQRRKIVRVIEDSLRSRGYPPSMREIGEAVGLASTSSVSYQLSVLEAIGYVSREAGDRGPPCSGYPARTSPVSRRGCRRSAWLMSR